MFYVLAYNADSECVVHRLVEEVPIELNDVGMILGLAQLNSFFLPDITYSL